MDTNLALACTYRRGKQVLQRELCRLGNLEELQASGQLDRLIQSLARFSRRRWVMAGETGVPPVQMASGLSRSGDETS